MYEITLSSSAEKSLKKLPVKTAKRIVDALKRIRFRPESFVTRIVNSSAYKFRVGDYRIILDINKGKLLILVIKIGHRKNIYK